MFNIWFQVLTQLITGEADTSSSRLTPHSTDLASVSGSVSAGVTSDADTDSVTTTSTLTSSVLADSARTAITAGGRTTTVRTSGIDECIGSVKLAAHTVSPSSCVSLSLSVCTDPTSAHTHVYNSLTVVDRRRQDGCRLT